MSGEEERGSHVHDDDRPARELAGSVSESDIRMVLLTYTALTSMERQFDRAPAKYHPDEEMQMKLRSIVWYARRETAKLLVKYLRSR